VKGLPINGSVTAVETAKGLIECSNYLVLRKEPPGGLGAFTPDDFPIFDVMSQNCYLIAMKMGELPESNSPFP